MRCSQLHSLCQKKALQDIPPHKATRHDAIPQELLLELWSHIGEDLLSYITEVLEIGEQEASIKHGITSLIPKDGSQSLLKNLRPISVLTALYKLIANRIQPILQDCVLPTKNAFINNTCILDNVFLAREAIEWASESGQEIAILLLDFEKLMIALIGLF